MERNDFMNFNFNQGIAEKTYNHEVTAGCTIYDRRTEFIQCVKIAEGDDKILTMTPKQFEWLQYLFDERDFYHDEFHKCRGYLEHLEQIGE